MVLDIGNRTLKQLSEESFEGKVFKDLERRLELSWWVLEGSDIIDRSLSISMYGGACISGSCVAGFFGSGGTAEAAEDFKSA